MEVNVTKRWPVWAFAATPALLRRFVSEMNDAAVSRAGGDATPSTVVRATTGDGELTFAGTVEEVLAELDHRSIQSLSVEVRPREYAPAWVTLNLRVHPPLRLGDLEVTGPDRTWVAGTFERLVEVLRQASPWWALLRRRFAWLGFPCAAAMLLLGYAADLPYLGVLVAIAIGGLLPVGVEKWVVVPLEIKSDEGASTTSKRLAVMGGGVSFLVAILSLPMFT